jgi:Pyruvate/2-oxoacid:ferredoxin oxidoreductase delta subunit
MKGASAPEGSLETLSQQKKPRKVGRPPLPKGHAKVGTLRIRVTPAELRAIESAAKSKKQNVSEWVRRVITSRNVERWYAFCPDESHITLFDKKPMESDYCLGCGMCKKLHGIGKGYVSHHEADKGMADSRPLSKPETTPPPTTL